MPIIIKRILLRALRGFAGGALGTMVTVPALSAENWNWGSMETWLTTLLFAFIVGGISGALQALELYLRNMGDKEQWEVA